METMMETAVRRVHGLHIEIDLSVSPRGVAFIAHGLGGHAGQPHILALRGALAKAWFIAVAWDARDTVESRSQDGDYRDATVTSYLRDLDTVIAWARSQEWFRAPYLMGGHSLGGFAALLHTIAHTSDVAGIFPFATVYSGPRWYAGKQSRDPTGFREWKRSGAQSTPSASRPGVVKTLDWNIMEDCLGYDALMEADRITVPACLAVGTFDTSTPPAEQRLLRDAMANARTSYLEISGMPHTPVDLTHLDALARHLSAWLRENFES